MVRLVYDAAMSTDCVVYRCARQAEMYLYVRAGMPAEKLPAALLQRTGKLTAVMCLQLTPGRKLARVDADRVREKLLDPGWYLQMPPDGHMNPHLHFGDGL